MSHRDPSWSSRAFECAQITVSGIAMRAPTPTGTESVTSFVSVCDCYCVCVCVSSSATTSTSTSGSANDIELSVLLLRETRLERLLESIDSENEKVCVRVRSRVMVVTHEFAPVSSPRSAEQSQSRSPSRSSSLHSHSGGNSIGVMRPRLACVLRVSLWYSGACAFEPDRSSESCVDGDAEIDLLRVVPTPAAAAASDISLSTPSTATPSPLETMTLKPSPSHTTLLR